MLGPMFDTLTLSSLHRPGDSNKHERHSVDFLVNGVSLFEATKAAYLDFCGRFSSDLTPAQNRDNERIFLLSGQPDTSSGRIMLFVCSECADLGCGAITMRITKDGDFFVWSEFAYENNYDEATTDFASYASIGPFRFEAKHYRSTLSKAVQAKPLAQLGPRLHCLPLSLNI